ncbi:type IV secretory system conjugative DNA transfer family protein [Planctomycetes bacterium TBK1r]|uniref:Conjugal transfer protein TraG n=1 Tax=Stieleria magnilauensis TaxID=2527963 RepID=A0ABX5XHA9_9BACT|nr:Conjugal transfer protein TraG [Planctomycetes bacterium TBK1r]
MNRKPTVLDSIFDDLPRGRAPDDVGTPPNACFESPRNVIATESLRFDINRNSESKIFLGVLGAEIKTGERLPDGRLTRYALGGVPIGVGDDRHVVTVAGSRSGKGRSALVANALSLPAQTSLMCIDPKGDIARLTATWRARHQSVAVLDPFGISGAHTTPFHVAYNALEMLLQSDRRTFVPNAKLIADSLIVSGDFKDKHWDECSRAILSGLCSHVATDANYEGRRDLITVWQLASELARPDPNNPNRYLLEKEMASNDSGGGSVRAASQAFYDRTGGEFSSVLSNLRKHLDWISIECMHDVLRGDSINLADLKRSAMSLYVTLPALRMSDLSGWLRLIAQMSFAAFEEETVSSGHQAVFLLDEFSVLGRLKCAETAIAQLAGLGVKCWIVVQDLSQLKSNYKDNWETFIANSGVFQFFGGADETTLSYVSKLLGQSMTLSRSASSPSFDQAVKEAATGLSWSLASQPLMTGAELGRFFGRDDKLLRQLIIRPSYRPMILQRAFYDKHELFRDRYWRA